MYWNVDHIYAKVKRFFEDRNNFKHFHVKTLFFSLLLRIWKKKNYLGPKILALLKCQSHFRREKKIQFSSKKIHFIQFKFFSYRKWLAYKLTQMVEPFFEILPLRHFTPLFVILLFSLFRILELCSVYWLDCYAKINKSRLCSVNKNSHIHTIDVIVVYLNTICRWDGMLSQFI